MVTSRSIHGGDLDLLGISLAKDETHSGTEPEFFMQPGTVCDVYEDELGPVCFVRGTKALRLDIQYVSNTDTVRNKRVMLEGFDKLAKKAADSGFTEIVFNTNSKLLARFCKQNFGFVESNGELRKFIQ